MVIGIYFISNSTWTAYDAQERLVAVWIGYDHGHIARKNPYIRNLGVVTYSIDLVWAGRWHRHKWQITLTVCCMILANTPPTVPFLSCWWRACLQIWAPNGLRRVNIHKGDASAYSAAAHYMTGHSQKIHLRKWVIYQRKGIWIRLLGVCEKDLNTGTCYCFRQVCGPYAAWDMQQVCQGIETIVTVDFS